MLRTDLHLHTRYSFDCGTDPKKLVARCVRRGLNCVAVTDHNTIRGAIAVRELAPFHVIVGEEISTTGGDIIGLFLEQEVPAGLEPMEAAQRVKEQGGLVSIPHPFDRVRGSAVSAQALADLLPLADIVEAFNARNILAGSDRQAMALAQTAGKAPISVSDAHTLGELGRTYVEMMEFDGTARGFMASLRHGSLVTHRSSALVHLATTYYKLRRRFPGRRVQPYEAEKRLPGR